MITSINIVHAHCYADDGSIRNVISNFEIEYTTDNYYTTTHLVSYQLMRELTFGELEDLIHEESIRKIASALQIEEVRKNLEKYK